MLIIGDVHGKTNEFYALIKKHKPIQSIQTGDLGFRKEHAWFLKTFDIGKHSVVFGNHDYIPFVHAPHSRKDYSYSPQQKLFTIRGAASIDKTARIENVDWWKEEEMSYERWKECIDFYALSKPQIVISHECPRNVARILFGQDYKSITNTAMEACLEDHQPYLWIFGHHHISKNEMINGTRFICLSELETFNLEV